MHGEYPSHTHKGYTHSHADDIAELETHKTERPSHTTHTSVVEHTHNELTHSHGEYPSHTHKGYTHSHADDITELETHKQQRAAHTPHKSFVKHTHEALIHTHDDFTEHTHAEYSHSHTDDITELEAHEKQRATHTPHTSFVEHTHSVETHSHGDYPSHRHKRYTHSHANDTAQLETHKQQNAPHSVHEDFTDHTHEPTTHTHDDFPEHTHASYSHTHPTFEPVPARDAYIPVKEELGQIVFSELMFESRGGLQSLPQWIEVFNTTTTDINLRGWKLEWYRRKPILLDTTIEIQGDFIIPANQTRLIVSIGSRHSGGNLGEESVYGLFSYHSAELQQNDGTNRDHLIAREGFYLKLLDGDGTIIDQIGTLTDKDAEQTWELPECLIDRTRTSLIRRFDKGVPRSGISEKSWIRAYDTEARHTGIWYGRNTDIGTPGYRSDETPLPVELSAFSARVVDGKVNINWTTESELINAGFNILRSTSLTRNFQVLNLRVIEGAGTTGEQSTYQFVDNTAKSNVAYYYRIEDIDFAGTRRILATQQLRGVISPTNKFTTTWSELKDDQ